MKSTILKDPIEVDHRLAELNTSAEMLLEVIDAVASAKADCTDNDPFGSRGWRGWQMGTRRLRDTHVGHHDWTKDDTDQVPSIASQTLGVRIVICNTDQGTGFENHKPQNNSKKGPATGRAVAANQASFFDLMPEPPQVVRIQKQETSVGLVITYYLCVFAEGDEIRAELSCPKVVEGGYFTGFQQRIFIVGGDAGPRSPVRRKSDDDDGTEFEIPVTRKK